MIIPYRDDGILSNQHVRYNTALSKTRCVIERAFALLKGRFRRLRFLNLIRLDLFPTFIIACCVLHKICIQFGNLEIDKDCCTDNDDGNGQCPYNINNNNATLSGAGKRDNIRRLF